MQFQCVPTTYVTENKEESYLEIYIFQVLETDFLRIRYQHS